MLECQECVKYLDAFLDCALDVKESLDVQEHLHACTLCTDRLEAGRALKAYVRQHACTSPLPKQRKQQIIRYAIRSAQSSGWWSRRKVAMHLRDIALGTVAAAAVIFLVLRPALQSAPANDMLQQFSREAAMTYTAYTATGQYPPFEVARAKDSAVIEWVKDHMGSRLQVPWITDGGTQFLGGRLCRILDRKSAVLVYRRQGANVLLLTFKGDPLFPPRKNVVHVKGHDLYVQTVSGRPVAIWQHGDMTYSMVGNLQRDTLLQLATTVAYR
jgi:anti-sigma factor RsiW